ncbi:MAG: 4-oxalocrotonate tautomerase family protein [Pseudomonadota bacterium]
MPLVQIKGVGRYLSSEQKAEMIRKVTDAVLAVEGEGLRQVTWVTIEDVEPRAWGVGGRPITADDLRALAGRNSKP